MVSWLKRHKLDDNNDDSPPGGARAGSFSPPAGAEQEIMFVKKLALNHVDDIIPIQANITGGHIAIIDVAGFISSGQYSVLELKRAIEQIRGTCKGLGGALARLGDRYLVATPSERAQLVV